MEITTAAKTSLLLTPDDAVPTQSFPTIKQGVDETFIKIVDRLKEALEKQLETKEAQKEMLVKMALTNAIADTKAILRSLLLDPEPTIEQMIEACVKHSSTGNTVVQAVVQGIAQGVSGAFAVVAAKENQRCFNCGSYRHFITECPEKEAVVDVCCDWLRKNPKKWWQSGNAQQRTDQRRAKTPNAQPPHFCCPVRAQDNNEEDQFPHRLKIQSSKVPREVRRTTFMPRYRWEAGVDC